MTFKTAASIDTFRTAEVDLSQRISKTSLLVSTRNDSNIIRLSDEDIKIGRVLGRGSYCVVNEVNITKKITDEKDHLIAVSSERNHTSKHTSPFFPYVIKRLDVTGSKHPGYLLHAVVDLAYEAALISSLCHGHIISVEGLSTHSPCDGAQFFVIFGRLVEFLGHRISVWKTLQHHGIAQFVLDHSHKKETALLIERLNCAFGISSAVAYLHKSNIMHRDIKPDNIGFDKYGVVKVTDFGLAREFNPADRQDDRTFFHLTEETGTMLYMDPHIAMGHPYNESCDVYSFSVLLWQIMELVKPFEGYTMQMYKREIIEKGKRPKVNMNWPESIQNILNLGWCYEISKRPTIQTIHEKIEQEIRDQTRILESHGKILH